MKKFAEMPVVTAFKKWDRHLLLNHPRLWALRLPVLVIYFVGGNLIALLVCGLMPLKPYHVNKMFTWLWLFGVVELILLGWWNRRFNQFSPEKALERTSPLNGLAEIISYILCILVFFSPTISSSFGLEIQFSQMIPLEELARDRSIVREYDWSSIYSEEIVEKYSRMDYEIYSRPDNGERSQINSQIRDSIDSLIMIVRQEDYGWRMYLVIALLLLHLSVFMFSYRHIREGVLGKAIIVGILLFIAVFAAAEAANTRISDLFSNFEYHIHRDDRNFFIFAAALTAIILNLSLGVFWQKRYRTATAVGITLLPYAFHVWLFAFFRYYFYNFLFHFRFIKYDGILIETFFGFMGDVVDTLIFGTPFLILWVFILSKAMYTRLLALPEG